MTEVELETDRETYRTQLLAYFRSQESGDTTAAEAANESIGQVMERWDERGQLGDLLIPLLDRTEQSKVRMGAATFLLGQGHVDVALSAMEDIRDQGDSMEAQLAGVVVTRWRQQGG